MSQLGEVYAIPQPFLQLGSLWQLFVDTCLDPSTMRKGYMLLEMFLVASLQRGLCVDHVDGFAKV